MNNLINCLYPKATLMFLLLLFTILSSCKKPKTTDAELMQKAVPVWAEGRETEMNVTLGFKGVFRAKKSQTVKLKITASSLYRVFLNGEFLGYGPARAAHGFFRVDEYDLGNSLKQGKNDLAIEVAGYNINTFYTTDQPSFLQAEVESDGNILLATGASPGFEAFQIKERLQKVERYCYQRPFVEYYRLSSDFGDWKTSTEELNNPEKLTEQPKIELLPRNVLMPEFNIVRPEQQYAKGTVFLKKPDQYNRAPFLVNIGPEWEGYKMDELTVLSSELIQDIHTETFNKVSQTYNQQPIDLYKNSFVTLDMGTNLTGFIGGNIECDEPCTFIFYFDEILTDGDANAIKRMGINNQVVYELQPGTYNLESFEAFTFKYLKLIVLGGKCRVNDVYLREYVYPENKTVAFKSSNEKLNAIFKAAQQTFRQNTLDIFMDCPSRERAGWLCDSYFTAIMEKDFTGKSEVAYNFYENFALPDSFKYLPDGMLPMCYPADQYDGHFIPNWAMWFIIQIDDFKQRGGDEELVARLETKITKLLNYFEGFENEDGLLEDLDSWIFIEWSRANDFVKNVNYPSNMLYCAALEKAGKLYKNDVWLKKATHIKQTILDQSFNGEFFVDNAVREDNGQLKVTNNTTEVCQYYAFFFNIATPVTHPELWMKLSNDFGPGRDDKVTYPEVYKANAFIGNYLRMDILSRHGMKAQLLSESQDYFYGMAKQTGTLWENMDSHASCNHGFASFLGHILYRDILGIEHVDYLNKKLTVLFSDIDLDECSGVLPVDDDAIELVWKKHDGKLEYSLRVPGGFDVEVINNTSLKIKEI